MKNVCVSPIKGANGERPPLLKVTLEQGLIAYQCPLTKGIYIPLHHYWNWLRKQPARLEHLPESEEKLLLNEGSREAKLCPDTGAPMMSYRVGHGFEFTIERSRTGGVWLDAGEWEALRQRQFHDELHLVFTSPWQRQAREVAINQSVEERMIQRFGKELCEEMGALKQKLKGHPYREYAIAYLAAES